MIAVVAFTKAGASLCARLVKEQKAEGFVPERYLLPGLQKLDQPIKQWAVNMFTRAEALVFIGAAGIAVRAISSVIDNKGEDPAVLCIDEAGRYVIPLLSGHIGGANALAKAIAADIGAVAVITTATDVQGKFSPDAWAAKQDCVVPILSQIKSVSAAILDNQPVGIQSDFPMEGDLPPGIVPSRDKEYGILVSLRQGQPYPHTLWIAPRCLRLGIGCRKGTDAAAIRQAVLDALAQAGLSIKSVRAVATIDLKKDEEGLLEFCKENALSIEFYTAEELQQVEGSRTPSSFVQEITGVDNVCERAAMAAGGELLVPKVSGNGVTVAVAAQKWRISFDE